MENTKKEQLLKNLLTLENAVIGFEGDDRFEMKKLLMQIADIVEQFNKGKHPNGDKDLDLTETELTSLVERVDKVWDLIERKNLAVWPKPDIVTKIG